MVVNTDLDCLIYRAGHSCKGDFVQTLESLEWFLQSIVEKTQASENNLILSGATNFRKEIDANYKSNRKESARPQYYKELRDYAVNHLGAVLTSGVEADDMLGILQTDETAICSIDKDLLQVPGWHFRMKRNWDESELIYIDEATAWFNFFKQTLVGDAVDCIEGVKNPAKSHHKNPPNFSYDTATKLLEGLTKEQMLETVQEMYRIQYGESWFEQFDKNCRLLFVQRNNAKEYFQLL
jgi:hypothetical protein